MMPQEGAADAREPADPPGRRPATDLWWEATISLHWRPFKGAARHAMEHPVQIPEADFTTALPVPATTADYDPASASAPKALTETHMAPAPQTAPQKIAGVIRTLPKKTSRKPKSPLSGSGNAASGELLVRAEEKLLPTADRLKAARSRRRSLLRPTCRCRVEGAYRKFWL